MKRVVIKVGSAVLTQDGTLAIQRLNNLVDLIANLSQKGVEVILVSSGAVASGYTLLQLDKSSIKNKQALAAIGQPLLMKHYSERFKEYGINCAQVLLIADDFDSRKRTAFAKGAIEILLENKVVPIINENDVTATDELIFGDNDQLAAHVSYYFEADLLAILTDIDGYYNKNPHEYNDAKLLKFVDTITDEMLEAKHSPNNAFATGGIVTKLKAANFLMQRNKKMYLSSGFDLKYAYEFLINNNHLGGTIFQVK